MDSESAVHRIGHRTMLSRNMPVPTTRSLAKIAAVCCCFYLTAPMADDTLAPSREDLRRFVTPYDGETRPDLVPFHRTIEEALAGYESRSAIDSLLNPADRALVDDFESGMLESYEEDDRVIGRMLEELCSAIGDLDGVQIAVEITQIDQTLISRRDTRAGQLVDSLSTSAAEVLRAKANEVAKLFGGSNTDAIALANEFPEFVKSRYVERCTTLGHISSGDAQDVTR